MTKKISKKTVKKSAKKTTKKVVKKSVKKTKKKVVGKSKESAGVIKSGVLQAGDKAPNFTLQDQNGRDVSLADFAGPYVLVYFYPRAMTPGCTVQACGLRDVSSELKKLGIAVLAVSPDSVKKLKQFEEKQRLNFTLLSDPDHKVIEAYGSWGLKKFMGREFMGVLRQSFLIGKNGLIAHVMHKVNTKTHHDDVLEMFKRLG